MSNYKYRPHAFFIYTFVFTWIFWGISIFDSIFYPDHLGFAIFLSLGLFVPSVVAVLMVRRSKSQVLKQDFKEKLIRMKRINFPNIFAGSVAFALVIFLSILISLPFGGLTDQFSFVAGFSFSIAGSPTLILLILTAILEELGWKGYAEDAIADRTNWFNVSLIFGILWSLWHLPLVFIADTYHSMILEMNVWYAVNFYVSIIPASFFFTWIYLKSNRSIIPCIIVHFVFNILQEEVAMTQTTKCIETAVFCVLTAVIVLTNKEMFFGRSHIGNVMREITADVSGRDRG
ncbi:MAG TPA: CPBP family intramembrane glutamic endopeptidase [Anaerovoracaceae bacterium]|nr:CPBP family intramembrane glutamic endopeptidase [Anaerovoracaceae bacterium]